MNKLEQRGFRAKLERAGWSYCIVGLESTPAWSRDGFTVLEKDIYYEEE